MSSLQNFNNNSGRLTLKPNAPIFGRAPTYTRSNRLTGRLATLGLAPPPTPIFAPAAIVTAANRRAAEQRLKGVLAKNNASTKKANNRRNRRSRSRRSNRK